MIPLVYLLVSIPLKQGLRLNISLKSCLKKVGSLNPFETGLTFEQRSVWSSKAEAQSQSL